PHGPGLILPAVLVALWWTLACRLNRRRMPDGPVTYTTPPRTEATMDQNIPPARATWHDYLPAGYLLASGVATAITTATDYLYGDLLDYLIRRQPNSAEDDNIITVKWSGNDDLHNLTLLCRTCNNARSDLTRTPKQATRALHYTSSRTRRKRTQLPPRGVP